MELNTVEKAIKTETDKRTEQKEWASSVGSCLIREPYHPHHVKVSPQGRMNE